MNDTTICDGCGCEIALAAANYAGPELPFWEGATLCNECYAAERPPTSGPGQSIGRHQPQGDTNHDGDGSGLGGRASKQLDRMVAVIAAATGEEAWR